MPYTKILLEQREAVGIIRLNDSASLNSLSRTSIEELDAAFDELARTCRAIVLTGEGRAFCSGAKLEADLEEDLGLILETHINPLVTKLKDLRVPWISAVRGAAAGAGCAIALCADLIVASENAYFLQAFVRIGLVPDSGSSHLLTRALGRPRALEMMLLGGKISANQALTWGLINRVATEDALESTAFELAGQLAAGPTRTLVAIRQMAWAAEHTEWDDTLRHERQVQKDIGRTHDAREGIAAFLQKRPPTFTGK